MKRNNTLYLSNEEIDHLLEAHEHVAGFSLYTLYEPVIEAFAKREGGWTPRHPSNEVRRWTTAQHPRFREKPIVLQQRERAHWELFKGQLIFCHFSPSAALDDDRFAILRANRLLHLLKLEDGYLYLPDETASVFGSPHVWHPSGLRKVPLQ